jgi:hypothetical protein
MASNGFSTLDDFRAAAQMEREARAEAVRLPSGLVARLVRPTPMEHLFFTGQLPQSLAARLRPDPSGTGRSAGATNLDDIVQLALRLIEQLQFIFVSPRVPDEARPGLDIPVPDVEYALRWARGEIAQVSGAGCQVPGGKNEVASHDLAEFPGDRRGTDTVTPAGAVGGDVPRSA